MKKDEKQQRRNKIVHALKLRDKAPGLDEARQMLARYLKERNMNSTPERDSVLSLAYRVEGPFDVDSMHQLVCEQKGYVCRVTVYNNLMLFVEAGVVARFQPFVNGSLFFERCVGQKPHGYQVCRRCGSIRVLNADGVVPVLADQIPASFQTQQYCLYAIGLCSTCSKELRHELRLKQMAVKLSREQQNAKTAGRREPRKRYTSIRDVRRDQELEALQQEKKSNKKRNQQE